MLFSLSLIFISGLFMGKICQSMKLPRIIGMLAVGIILGPSVLNLLDDKILLISPDLRQMALIIILIKAGLSLNLSDLKKVGRPALLMSFLPASFEILAYVVFAPLILGVSMSEAAIIGSVLAAVSPAVVVPRMVHLTENRYGTDKAIPQMIMAGASCDDIFVIVLFTTFLGIQQGQSAQLKDFLNIPVSIITGVILGCVSGLIISFIFERLYKANQHIRNSVKVIIILSVSFILVYLEDFAQDYIALSGLIAVVAMACTIKVKSIDFVSKRLSEKFGKLWLAAEVILFVLVGAAVDIRYMADSGFKAVILILLSLAVRSIGVFISVLGTNLNLKERVYCIFAYLPKATVQAAIGSVPLSLGLKCGNTVLSVAVMGIIITAPLGAFLMDFSYKKLLEKNI